MSKVNAIIVDIDGTLANCDHRRHHLEKTPKDWDSFFGETGGDTVNEWCKEIIYRFKRVSPQVECFEILMVSARSEALRDVTIDWLVVNKIPFDEVFLVREEGNFEQDDALKERFYLENIRPFYNVLFALDDRTRVVDMWRRNGVACLQCAKGDF